MTFDLSKMVDCVVLKIFTTPPLQFSGLTSPSPPFPVTRRRPSLYHYSRRNTMAAITLHHRNRNSKLPFTHQLHCHLTTGGHFGVKYQ